jgi:hypothetical protein
VRSFANPLIFKPQFEANIALIKIFDKHPRSVNTVIDQGGHVFDHGAFSAQVKRPFRSAIRSKAHPPAREDDYNSVP